VLTFTSWFTNRRLAQAVALLTLAVSPAYSQSQLGKQPPADRLIAVSASGSQKFSSDQIVAAASLKRGDMVTRDALQAAADALGRLGTFKDVQYRFTTLPSGVKVEFVVADSTFVPVRYDNFPGFSDAELNDALKAAVILFDGTAPEGGPILDSMDAALAQAVATRGLIGDVKHSAIRLPDGREALQFRIDTTALKVGSIEFTDALARDDHGLRERVTDLIGKPYSRSSIELFEFEQIRPIYLAHAYLRVKFGPITAGFTGNPGKVLPDNVVVYAPIEAGPAYTFGGITWSGNKLIASADLDTLIVLMPGQVANGNRLELTWEHVRDAYAKSGYLDAAVMPNPAYDDAANRVSFDVSITEGPQYHMGELVLTGLSLEGERRIRNAWNIARGAVFDRSAYDQFIASGIPQAFLGLAAHYDKIGHFLETNQKTATVEVLLDFQ
jgi:outer membrane protein assembly factor BamA